MIGRAGLPFGFTLGELSFGQLYVKSAEVGVDFDDVAVAQERDRPAHRRFGSDMANAETARGAREPAVGDQGYFTARALAGQRCRRRKHFAHAWTTTRTFITDDDDLAFLVGPLLHRLKGILFAVEATGGTGKFQVRHTRDLHDRTLRREISLQANNATGDGDRLVGRPHHVLVRVPFHAFEVLGDRSARDRQTVTVQVAIIEQRL